MAQQALKAVTFLQPEGHNLLVKISAPAASGQIVPSIIPVSNDVIGGEVIKQSPIGTGNITEGTFVYFPAAAGMTFLDGTANLQLTVVSEQDIIASRRVKLPVVISGPTVGQVPRFQ